MVEWELVQAAVLREFSIGRESRLSPTDQRNVLTVGLSCGGIGFPATRLTGLHLLYGPYLVAL